jgi:DNA-binding transcriptional regulator GbsR (MarR family)
MYLRRRPYEGGALRDDAVEFIEGMGRRFEEEGVPRIAGRMFGLMMVNEEPCSLDEMAEVLQVSKGSVSSNARLLEQWGVAERTTRPGDRRDYYQLADDMPVRMLERQIAQMEAMLAYLRRGQVLALHEDARELMRQALARRRSETAEGAGA